MTKRLFNWIRLGQKRPARSTRSTAGSRQQRLAFEAVEPRLLLSVATGDVSEGGMVSFGATLTLDMECSGFCAGGNIVITDAGSGERSYTLENAWDSLTNSMETLGQPTSAPRLETVVPNTPKNIDLDDEDFSPTTPEAGMVDLTAVAYDRVFAEIGNIAETPGLESIIATRMEPGSTSDTHDPAPSSQIEHRKEPSARRILTGSRGRLAAFDLAIHELSATNWHRDVAAPNVQDAASEVLSPEADPGPARSPRPAVEAFSENDRDSGAPTGFVADATPAMTRVASQQQAALTPSTPEEVGPEKTTPADEPAGQLASSQPGESHNGPRRGLAVQLDPPREKNPVHLVLLAGISQAIFRRNWRQTADSGYEQLPPRKR